MEKQRSRTSGYAYGKNCNYIASQLIASNDNSYNFSLVLGLVPY